MTIDTTDTMNQTVDQFAGCSPSEGVINAGGQTLPDATAARSVPVTRLADYATILAEVGGAAVALRAGGVERIVIDLSVDYEPTTIEYVIRPALAEDDASIPSWISLAAVGELAERVAGQLLPDAARAMGADGVMGFVYVRRVGGYWHIDSASASEAHQPDSYRMLSDDDTQAAARHAWLVLGGPRSLSMIVVPQGRESLFYSVEDYRLDGGVPHYEPVHAFQVLRSQDSDRDLPDGSDQIVRQMHRSATTGMRHASRVRAAKCALVQYVLDECWCTPASDMGPRDDVARWVLDGGEEPSVLASWAIGVPQVGGHLYTADEAARILSAVVAFEIHGVGGPGGTEGGATATMSWRRGLGKGRRQASDGQAWDAAIIGAGGGDHVTADDALLAVPFVRPVDLEWPMAYALHRAYETRGDAEESRRWCDVARAVMARAEEPGSPSDSGAIRLGWRYGVSGKVS